MKSDILVIGSGIAGLSIALKAAALGSVLLITKKEKAESNTNYAQGGIATVVSSLDTFDLHIEDTLRTGVGLGHRDSIEIMIKEAPERLNELVEIGVQFTEKNGSLDLGREGGHSRNRIVHARDHTGAEIERALLHAISIHPNITLLENHLAIDLITEHHLGEKYSQQKPIHCWGAYVLDVEKNVVKKILSSFTVLASGGAGHVYLHTTNPLIATGDGVAMAYRAGALIGNMEFIQFHPTSLFNSGSPSYLISEAIRGFGGKLMTRKNEEFMLRYDSRGSLAPRDIVAQAIDIELKKSGDEYIILDLRHLDSSLIREKFPSIYKTCLEKFKIDITAEPIPVVPAAHYSCGGVVTDLFGKTTIDNLYACGEVAMTGVHGANRLASNSLLEALVFAHRAYRDMSSKTIKQIKDFPAVPEWDESGTFGAEEWVLIEHDRKEIQQIMWDYVGIVRSNLRLDRANRRLILIKDEIENFYKRTKVTEGLIELRNLSTVADLIIKSALQRKESRGLHYTTDYPNKNDDTCLHDTLIKCIGS
ncbi:MAG: L-aspartate oxidase [Ignavibacteriales bacterium]|nr:L-aspartate oxidase [Ignavibacteriales bacterium]